MAHIKIACPHCGGLLGIKPERIGKPTICPKCNTGFTASLPNETPELPAAPPLAEVAHSEFVPVPPAKNINSELETITFVNLPHRPALRTISSIIKLIAVFVALVNAAMLAIVVTNYFRDADPGTPPVLVIASAAGFATAILIGLIVLWAIAELIEVFLGVERMTAHAVNELKELRHEQRLVLVTLSTRK